MRFSVNCSFVLLLTVTACGAEDLSPAPVENDEPRVLLGEASTEGGERVLVGVVVRQDRYALFACGDQDYPFGAWFGGSGVNTDSAEFTIDITPPGGWQMNLSLGGDEATGSIFRDDFGTTTFVASAIDTAGGAGVYSDDNGCKTGVIVPVKGEPLGSFCTGASTQIANLDARAQVTPLRPEGLGWMVELTESLGGTGEQVLVAPVMLDASN